MTHSLSFSNRPTLSMEIPPMLELTTRIRSGLPVPAMLIFMLLTPLFVEAQDGTWEVGPRTVGPPAGASAELQETLEAEPQPNPALRRRVAPSTPEAWRRLIDTQNQQRLVPIETLEKDFGVMIEKDRIKDVPVFRVTPNPIAPAHEDHLFLHLHGGGYVLGGGENAVAEAAILSGSIGIPAISVDYRMPPDHPFPAAVDDAVAVYRSLLNVRDAETIAIGGTSAGGGLSLAAVHRIIAEGLPTPGAIFAGTPWADLTKTGDTLFTNEGIDRTLVTYDGMLEAMAELYADGASLKNPQISPVYGTFEAFPPTYFVTGTRDLFLSDTARTHRKMKRAGVIADLNVYEGQSHADYIIEYEFPESVEFREDLGDFLEAHLAERRGFFGRLIPPFLRRD